MATRVVERADGDFEVEAIVQALGQLYQEYSVGHDSPNVMKYCTTAESDAPKNCKTLSETKVFIDAILRFV